MSLLVLVWRPLLVGRAWESFSSQPMVTDDADDMIGPIKENPIEKTAKKRNGSSTVPKQRIPFNEVVANVSMIWGYNLGL